MKTIKKKRFYAVTVCSGYLSLLFLLPSLFILGHAQLLDRERESQGLLLNATLDFKRDDNILRTSEPDATNILTLRPKIEYVNNKAKYNIKAAYQGLYSKYNEFDNLDFTDHLFLLNGRFDHSRKIGSSINVFHRSFSELPGTTNSLTTTILDEFNRVERSTLEASGVYGTTQSKGQIKLAASFHRYRYTNNQQAFRDFNEKELAPTFFYRLTSKVRTLIQARFYDYDYLNPVNGLDGSNEQTILYTGIEWVATAKTAGVIKVGHITRNFDDPDSRDVSGFSFEIEGKWRPNSYTEFALTSERETLESAEIGVQAFINTYYALDLQHELSPLTTLEMTFRQDKSDIEQLNRYNTLKQYKFGLTRHMKRWLDIKVSFKDVKRTSTDAGFDFNNKEIGISIITFLD